MRVQSLRWPTMNHCVHHWTRLVIVLGVLLAGSVAPVSGQALEWRPFEEALAVADTSRQPLFVHVYAPWCGWCHKMETEVYPRKDIRDCLHTHFVRTRLNRDDTDTRYQYRGQRVTARRLAMTLRAENVPAIVLLDPDGQYLLHVPGFVEPAPLQEVLAYVATGTYQHISFEEYRSRETPACTEERNDEGYVDRH